MSIMVHNRHTPEDLESFDLNEKRIAYGTIGSFCMIFAIPLVLLALFGFNPDNVPDAVNNFTAVWMIFWMILMMVIAIPYDGMTAFRKKVCKALAGLELGVLHCSDDLVILLDISREDADRIISGDYDNWLKHRLTCKYIG